MNKHNKHNEHTSGKLFYQFMIFFTIMYIVLTIIGCSSISAEQSPQNLRKNEVFIVATFGQMLKVGDTNYNLARIYSIQLIDAYDDHLPTPNQDTDSIIVYDEDVATFNAFEYQRVEMVLTYTESDSLPSSWTFTRFQEQL